MLINCVTYENGRKLADIALEDIDQWVRRSDCFVWVALRDATDDELLLMQQEFDLHALAVEDARHGHQRPKVEEYGDTLFLVMKLPEMRQGELEIGEVAVFVGRNFVLSARSNCTQGFQDVRERCERETGLLTQGAGFVLYALMDAVVDRYFPVVDQLESELEAIEEKIFVEGAARNNIQRLYGLKRKVMQLKHVVAPLIEVAGKLSGGRGPAGCASSRDYFRDVYDHLMRLDASIDTIRETIGTAIQVNLSMVAISDSEVSKRLAAWAGIFAVATAFAGIWGMNFEFMPELGWKYGYPAALLAIAATCLILYRRFRRAGWL